MQQIIATLGGGEGGKPRKIYGANIPKFSAGFINSFVHDCRSPSVSCLVSPLEVKLGDKDTNNQKESITDGHEIRIPVSPESIADDNEEFNVPGVV